MGRPIGSRQKSLPMRCEWKFALATIFAAYAPAIARKLFEMAEAGDLQAIKEAGEPEWRGSPRGQSSAAMSVRSAI